MKNLTLWFAGAVQKGIMRRDGFFVKIVWTNPANAATIIQPTASTREEATASLPLSKGMLGVCVTIEPKAKAAIAQASARFQSRWSVGVASSVDISSL